MNRVVITAAQSLTAAGIGRRALAQALQENHCMGSLNEYNLPIELVARIRDNITEHPEFIDDRKSWLGIETARLAWKESGIEDFGRLGIFLGTGLSSITPFEMNEDLFVHITENAFDREAMSKDLSPDKAAPKRHLPHYLAEFLQKQYNAQIAQSNFSACAAAAQAIASGLWSIRRGEVDVALVGGQDSMDHPMGLLSFVVLGALSSTKCRPFDVHRNGFMLGEGAGYLVLESLEHAQKRGAVILAELCGAGSSMDAWKPTAPHPEGVGAEKAILRALKDAKMNRDEIGYVNAHGTGTPLGDVAESMAINRVFGAEMKVSSIKGAIGHCIAAAGAVEAVACIDALQNGWLPGTVGLENHDPECAVQALQDSEDSQVQAIVSNSFGFGGQNCSVIYKKWMD